MDDAWGGGGSSSPKANGYASHAPSKSNGSGGFSALLERGAEEEESGFGHGGLPEAAQGLGYDPEREGWALGRQKKVEVHMRDELEGFILKHTIWFVASEVRGLLPVELVLRADPLLCAQQGATVQRRYSDFVWLLECLIRRYPFRMLPALPPKRVHIAGSYIAVDDLFLERRRRGLERFLTFLVNHPTLKRDGLLKTILEEQSVSR